MGLPYFKNIRFSLNKKDEKIIIFHAFDENDGQTGFLLSAKYSIKNIKILIAYIQVTFDAIESYYELGPDEMAYILEQFYGFDILEKNIAVNNISCLKIELCQVWNDFATVLSNFPPCFYRDGLQDYLQEVKREKHKLYD